MKKSKNRLEVGFTGVKSEGDSAERLGELLSPFTNLGRALGDRVSYWGELWNFEYVIKAQARAKSIAEKEDLSIEAKPMKFLRQWAVKASLEEDESLQDKWARLLLNSSPEYDSSDLINTEILSKIDQKDANILDNIWRKSEYGSILFDPEIELRTLPTIRNPIDSVFGFDFPVDTERFFLDNDYFSNTFDYFKNSLSNHGILVDDVDFKRLSASEIRSFTQESYNSRIAKLIHIGVLDKYEVQFEIGGGHISVDLWFIGVTNIGRNFLFAVNGKLKGMREN